MDQLTTPDSSLRELCFDLTAGLVDRMQFQALVQDRLRRWLRCESVHVRCWKEESEELLAKIGGRTGWTTQADEDQRLYAAMAHNGRLVGAVSCVRPIGAPDWTDAEGLLLRRLATVLTNHSGCAVNGVHSVFEQEEGVSP